MTDRKPVTIISLCRSSIAMAKGNLDEVLLILTGSRDDDYHFAISPENMAQLGEQLTAASGALIDAHLAGEPTR